MDWLEELKEICLLVSYDTDYMIQASHNIEREYAQIRLYHMHRNNEFITTVDVMNRVSCEVFINDGFSKQHFEYCAGETKNIFYKILVSS